MLVNKVSGLMNMPKSKSTCFYFVILMLILTACNALPQPIEPTLTRNFTAATLPASPTVAIRNSDEIYGDTILDGQSNPTAAALPVDAPLPPVAAGIAGETGAQTVQIVVEDGTTLIGELYEDTTRENRVPGLLIVGDDVQVWNSLALGLFDAGYTVLVIALPQNPRAELLDTLLTSLSENGTVDPARIAVIGAENFADFAFLGCTIYEICDAVVMLSPQNRDAILNVLPNYNPRPLFLAASQNDANSYATASSIATSFADGSRFVEQSTGSGTGLLALNSELSNFIITWLGTVWNNR